MTENIDLKEIERKAWTSHFEDGLWDIFFGLLMLGMGVNTIFEDTLWYIAVIALGVGVHWAGRQLITEPRVGRVKFGPARQLKRRKVMVVLAVSVLAGAVMWLVPLARVDVPAWVIAAVAGVWFLIVFTLLAYFLEFGRLYAYGLMISTSFALALAVSGPIVPAAFFVSGAVALLIGIVALVRFLRRYPRPAAEGLGDRA